MQNNKFPPVTSALSGSDPLTQYNNVIQNVYRLKYNVDDLLQELGKQVPIQQMPCELSKFMTNGICKITDKFVNSNPANQQQLLAQQQQQQMLQQQYQQQMMAQQQAMMAQQQQQMSPQPNFGGKKVKKVSKKNGGGKRKSPIKNKKTNKKK